MSDENSMREIEIEKMILSVGGIGADLDKGVKLLEKITGKKATKRASKKRIPGFGIRPGLEIGAMVTLRKKEIPELLKRLLQTYDNRLKEKQISDNFFSFGIHEYIEVPGLEYDREIGIIGFDVTVVFVRPGKRVVRKKIKKGRLPKKQQVTKQEIIKFMEEKFQANFGED